MIHLTTFEVVLVITSVICYYRAIYKLYKELL